jgi:hypothetical protein
MKIKYVAASFATLVIGGLGSGALAQRSVLLRNPEFNTDSSRGSRQP